MLTLPWLFMYVAKTEGKCALPPQTLGFHMDSWKGRELPEVPITNCLTPTTFESTKVGVTKLFKNKLIYRQL